MLEGRQCGWVGEQWHCRQGKGRGAAPPRQQRALPGKSLLLHHREPLPWPRGSRFTRTQGQLGRKNPDVLQHLCPGELQPSPPPLAGPWLAAAAQPSPQRRRNQPQQGVGRGKGPLSSSAQDTGTARGQSPHQPCSRAGLERISHGHEFPSPFLTYSHPSVERRKEVGRISPVQRQQREFGQLLPLTPCSCCQGCGRLCRAPG